VEELIKRLEEKGINVEDLLINALAKEDPQEGIKLRVSLAEKYMSEAEEYVKKGDVVQASEKVYKVAEEVIKALSEKFNLQEYQQAIREGRWYTYLLVSASEVLSTKLGDWVIDGWSSAYILYVWGFHEGKLPINRIEGYISKVRKMLEEAKKTLY
jgi:hypothetical protein